jgi:hypothetical protein
MSHVDESGLQHRSVPFGETPQTSARIEGKDAAK